MVDAYDGVPIDNPAEKKLLIQRVNEAAKDLYEKSNFQESLFEEIFNIDVNSQVIALPWYVEYVRGWRFFNSRIPGLLDSKENRYNEGRGNETWYQKWRHVKHSPIQREISNESQLVLSIPEAEDVEFDVNITGATANSDRRQDKITFAVGETEKTSTLAFKDPIVNLQKSTATKQNLTVADAEGNVLSVIPNHRLFALYKIIQIFDWDNMYIASTSAQVEVLFKKRFSEMVEDFDEFLFGDKYDKAIFWKYKEHTAKNIEAANAFASKCSEVLLNIEENEAIGTRRVINFRKSPFVGLPYGTPFGPVGR